LNTKASAPGALLAAAGFLAACGRASTPDLAPDAIVSRSAERMRGMPGFHFLIEREGAPAFLDPNETLSFRRAEGEYASPDRVRAAIRVIAPGMVAEISVISIGAIQWETNFLTGEWQELPADWGFNPGVLFDPETGIQAALVEDLSALVIEGTEELEELPGKALYHLHGLLAGERLHTVSYGMIGPNPAEVDLWIDPGTFELHRMVLVEPGEEEATIWTIDFWDFDEIPEILPPTTGEGSAG
jgi:hypothetical protein